MTGSHYDLVVIGAGPAGEKGASLAAFFGRNVLLVERNEIGGAALNTGTLPSKTLRETALYLSGLRQRGLYGLDYSFNRDVTAADLLRRERDVVQSYRALTGQSLARSGIEVVQGTATIDDPHTVCVRGGDRSAVCLVTENILIATGSRPYRPASVSFDGEVIYDSDGILHLKRIPRSLVIIGAGVIGCEYATLFATLGIEVTLVDNDDKFLPFLDDEIGQLLMARMRALEIELLFDRQVATIKRTSASSAAVSFAANDDLQAEAVLFCAGRSGNVEELGLEKLGVKVDRHGCIEVNDRYQTAVPSIYAAGDVIGPPALASTSAEQGRAAAAHAFDLPYQHEALELAPCGIYTIPEVSMVGATERELVDQGRSYLAGRAFYKQNPRGQIAGDTSGLLKLLFDPADLRLLGVHIIGEQATELIHTGQACMYLHGTLKVFAENVFNFPTLSDLYKYAAFDGLEKLTPVRDA